jgi:hypothetical protein
VPWFALIGRDGPRGAELRKQHREAHLEGIAALDAQDRVRHAGPLLDEAGAPVGSVVVFEAPGLAEARALVEADPYVVQGVFERWEVYETRPVFPRDG